MFADRSRRCRDGWQKAALVLAGPILAATARAEPLKVGILKVGAARCGDGGPER